MQAILKGKVMSKETAQKVEDYLTGTPPEEITGSPQVRLAVGLIIGRSLMGTEIDDDQAWMLLTRSQRRVVAQYLPDSKFAQWLGEELRDEAERGAAQSPVVRQLMKRIVQVKAGGDHE